MPVSRRTTWSLAVPLLVLAGLFAMHGLGDHTATHSGIHASMAGHELTIAGHGGPALSPLTGSGMSGAMAGLCVVVLLVGLLVGLVLGRALRRTPWALPRQVWLRAPSPRSRAPDPPTPLLLSVCRC